MNFELHSTCDTHVSDIYMAGDINEAKKTIRKYCERGFCVSIIENEYIYTYGQESGFKATIINYPRFARDPNEIEEHSLKLAIELANNLSQGSFTIVNHGGYITHNQTKFYSRREADFEQRQK